MFPDQESFAMATNTQSLSLDLKSSEREVFDPVSLLERVSGDRELLRELVELFAQECPAMLSDIESAVKQGSSSSLQQASHKMKGSVLQFSAATAATMAGALEEMGKTGALSGSAQEYLRLRAEIASLVEGLKLMVSEDSAQ
jgi:HPt (histidine-containing phosphotransfer) domain-containing protein